MELLSHAGMVDHIALGAGALRVNKQPAGGIPFSGFEQHTLFYCISLTFYEMTFQDMTSDMTF